MNIQAQYESKRRTPGEAIQYIEPHTDVIVPIMAGEPPALIASLAHHPRLEGNRLYRMLPAYPVLDVSEKKLKQVSLFLGGQDRVAFRDGLVDLLPNHFSDIPALLKQMTTNRVIMAAVSPMDEEGYFSLGVSAAYTVPFIADAKQIILEVNENMPKTYGENNRIHISQVTALVENHQPLPSAPPPVLTEKDEVIGKTIAGIIKDGDTLQIGFGAMPNAVMSFLTDHRDLGIYTEMLPDKIVDLYEAGAISNAKKSVFQGKSTMTFAFGTQRLYDFMHENKDLYMLPCDQSNNVCSIAQLENLVSINSTVEVDFLGQCNSETVVGNYYSSTGGQSDFAKGARLAKNGRGIICLYSTTKNDTISKIVPRLPAGAVATTSKNDVDFIVTEYGVAELKGKTIRERTESLIQIAHPKFREELEMEAKKLGYLPLKKFYV
ncbi:acetyl-CoA hydrolase/transferase C-terminal domain-containing protein [Bacillus sp. CGMCC 1.16541]|uniref:acetyl-CoA hydrolase/transferase family protein n=1 Tax=Bacillus sp. CGMCC 1.16541 TaxID=2185143 RepID=UPI001EF691AF|nr:acetyl-CoA hydrolase/transferase C-terminal domain-containing protein [Bacillus sp. CGMCC 1.16541]